MDCKLLFLLVAFCVVGSAVARWKPKPPVGSSTGPYNPRPNVYGQGRRVRSVPLEQDQALDEIYEHVEPLVDIGFGIPPSSVSSKRIRLALAYLKVGISGHVLLKITTAATLKTLRQRRFSVPIIVLPPPPPPSNDYTV